MLWCDRLSIQYLFSGSAILTLHLGGRAGCLIASPDGNFPHLQPWAHLLLRGEVSHTRLGAQAGGNTGRPWPLVVNKDPISLLQENK